MERAFAGSIAEYEGESGKAGSYGDWGNRIVFLRIDAYQNNPDGETGTYWKRTDEMAGSTSAKGEDNMFRFSNGKSKTIDFPRLSGIIK